MRFTHPCNTQAGTIWDLFSTPPRKKKKKSSQTIPKHICDVQKPVLPNKMYAGVKGSRQPQVRVEVADFIWVRATLTLSLTANCTVTCDLPNSSP